MKLLPDLAELLALRGAAAGVDLHAHRPALACLPGGHRSVQRGRGLEFEEVRLYAAGDDIRRIDWRVTARRGRPHTKLFGEEREKPVWLIADLHAGLYFGSRRQLKSALLLRTAAVLGWAAINGGDRCGAVIAASGAAPRIFPGRSRQAGVLPALDALVNLQPTAPAALPPPGAPADALAALIRLIQPGSLVLVISDFAGVDAAFHTALGALAPRNDCRLLWITDPLESQGLPAGRFRAGVPGHIRWLDGARSQDAWRGSWRAREATLNDLSRRLALPLIRLSTADAVEQTLPALLREPEWAA